MNHITLNKRPGESYKPHTFKLYDVCRNGEVVGTVESDYGMGWNVKDSNLNHVSRHSTIKAAARVAGRVL